MRWPRVTGNPHFHRALRHMPRHVPSRVLIALALAATLLPTGCVRRRLAVRSNPPGALVFVDNQQIGTTPCSVDFTYYGTREIRLVKPGFETLTVNQPIPTPWYQIPPLDFVSENVMPNKIEDHRTVAFDLQPQLIVPTEQLLDRANQLRQDTLSGAAAPPVAAPGLPPNFAPTPTTGPTPLPPVTTSPMTQPPVSQVAPPQTFSPPTFSPPTFPPPSLAPNTASPSTGVPSTAVPSTAAPTFAPAPSPFSTPAPAPFSAPTLPASPPASTQQGPPIVSPPLR